MRLSNRFRSVTGFLAKGSPQRLVRKGTFLVAQRSWSQWLDHPVESATKYMVTARHVVETHGDLFAVAFHDPALTPKVWAITKDSWVFPPSSTRALDLAVRVFDPPTANSDEASSFLGLPTSLGTHKIDEPIELGQPAFVVGLLAWEHRDLPWSPRPVVRSATIAAIDETGISWGEQFEWTAERVHLLDTRSRSGFSGSPCFVQFYLPDTSRDAMPEVWKRVADFAGNPVESMGTLRTVTHWLGLFVAYADESGIGIVIPSDVVDDALQSLVEPS